jgi:hypothetical protein
MTGPPMVTPPQDTGASRFRRTLVKVMSVQVVTLALLWWLQSTFSH